MSQETNEMEANEVPGARPGAEDSADEVARALGAAKVSQPEVAANLLPLVYEELRRLAAHHLEGEGKEHILQPTALVHEAWLKLSSYADNSWHGRQHFLLAAAEAMRRILVDRARRRLASKRGGGAFHVALDDAEIEAPATEDHLLRMEDALARLASHSPDKAELVKLRYYAGMTFDEVAEVLGVSVSTAKQWWAYSRAWLRLEMTREEGGS